MEKGSINLLSSQFNFTYFLLGFTNAECFSDCIIRLPFYNVLKEEQIEYIVEKINKFYN